MGKFDFSGTVAKLQKAYEKDEQRMKQFGLGSSLDALSQDPKDYVVLPDWWKEYFGVLGLPFGKWVQISGRPDAGKTSLALIAIKAAQEQGFGVLYVETETKTGADDLIIAGIIPEEVLTVKTNITEQVFENINQTLDVFFDDFPEEKLLLIIDSYGNTTSQRDADLNLTEKGALVGGAAKSNRLGLGAIRAKQNVHPLAVLIINYSYANLGSVGETNAGGRALEFFCSLIIQAKCAGKLFKTVKGVQYKKGVEVKWNASKNHFQKALPKVDGKAVLLPKELVLQITSAGMQVKEKK